jgi:RNA polymerase sigma-70 factor (ECF subfamily)
MGGASPEENSALQRLVDGCLARDERAIRALIERYQGRVMALCCRMLGHHQDAEDVAQETFVRVVRSLEKWDRTREFEPWLLAIAANRCKTRLAQRGRLQKQPLVEEPSCVRSTEARDASYLAEELQLGLLQLRAEYRQAFVLFHEHEMSYQEIADALSSPLGTIKTWVHRARQDLIQFLTKRGVIAEPQHAL